MGGIMRDSSNNAPDSTGLIFALVCSVVINLGQYVIANDAIRNLERQIYKASEAVTLCEGKFQGFIQGRR